MSPSEATITVEFKPLVQSRLLKTVLVYYHVGMWLCFILVAPRYTVGLSLKRWQIALDIS